MKCTVVVTVARVHVVQVVANEVIDMIPVRDALVPTVRPVDVVGRVRGTRVSACARRRIRFTDGDDVLVDLVTVHMMQVPVVEIVHVALVLDRRVTTLRAVLV